MFEKKKNERIAEEVERLEKERLDRFRKDKLRSEKSCVIKHNEEVASMEHPWNRKKRKNRDKDLEMAQRNKRRKVDKMAGYSIQERDTIIDDLVTWRTWATKSCEKAGNFVKFKKALQYDRERVLRRMECLGMEKIMMDVASWWRGKPGFSAEQQQPPVGWKMEEYEKEN